jgi:hypothetical protein
MYDLIAAPNMTTARSAHASVTVNNSIIVCGGYNVYVMYRNATINGSKSCEQFNGTAWNAIASMPTGVLGMSMVTLNNYAYMFGGSTSVNLLAIPMKCGNVTADVLVLNGSSWMAKSAMPEALMYQSTIALDADRALVCGGCKIVAGNAIVSNLCYVYTASTDKWTAALSMRTQRMCHAMLSLYGKCLSVLIIFCVGNIYVLGGTEDASYGTTSVEMYNTTANATEMAFKEIFPAAVTFGNFYAQ